MAPLVVILSVALGLGVAHLAAPADDQPAAGEDISPTTASSPAPASGTPTPAEPTPSVSADPGQLLELNDASLTVPASWTITSDELVEGDRRAVRLVEAATDARLQAVTPGASQQTPLQACEALVALQRQAYTGVTTHLVLELSVPGAGDGVTCGFDGTRSSDEVGNVVSFTLLRRDVDGHLLMLRATTPDAVPPTAEARSQLVGMQCEASRTFGVPLPLC